MQAAGRADGRPHNTVIVSSCTMRTVVRCVVEDWYSPWVSGFACFNADGKTELITPEVFRCLLIALDAMGQALLALDVEAGPEYHAGCLMFNEQDSLVTTNNHRAQSRIRKIENWPPIRRVASCKRRRNVAGLLRWASAQRHVDIESW